jgi:hypothetical protein
MENKGVQCGDRSVPDVNFVKENELKLYNAPVPDGYVIFWIPASRAPFVENRKKRSKKVPVYQGQTDRIQTFYSLYLSMKEFSLPW